MFISKNKIDSLPTSKTIKKKHVTFTSVVATISFYVCLFLISINDLINPTVLIDGKINYTRAFPRAGLLLLVFSVLSGLCFDREYRQWVLGKVGIVYGFLLLF